MQPDDFRDPYAPPSPQTLSLDASLRSRPPPRRRVWPFVSMALCLSLVAIGMGGYAYQLLGQRKALERNVATLEKTQSETEEQVVTLVAEKERQIIRGNAAEDRQRELSAKLAATEAKLSELEESKAEIDQRLGEFRDLRAKFQQMIDSGQLDITFRRGRMIVEMPAQVLFDSGSAELSEEGQKAVLSVARILAKVPKHRFLVGGHTDNVPAVKEYKSNWALSAARAVGVTEALVSHGISPRRLVVAGYSQYDPVATNGSEVGRQKNRRIEIVLEPYVERQVAERLQAPDAKK